MSNPPATKSTVPAKPARRQQKQWLIVWGVALFVVVGLLTTGRVLNMERPPGAAERKNTTASNENGGANTIGAATKPAVEVVATASAEDLLVDDDGKTLWVSPTEGAPLELGYLSPGAQIILALRPAELAGHAEGEKILAALGPLGTRGSEFLEATLLNPRGVDQFLMGFRALSNGSWETSLVARLDAGVVAAEHLAAMLPDATKKEHGGKTYWLANGWAYYAPPGKNKGLLVVAPENSIADVIDLGGAAPPLRRDIERLVVHTDADRILTIILAPNSLFSEGQSIFAGEMTRLREPLFWFLGDELSSAALSLHLDADNFFVELIATPTLDTTTEKASRILVERVTEMPDKLEEYTVNLNAQPYGRHVIARFPAMVRKLAVYTRSGFDRDHAVLRCYLPAVAAHNLLMGAELTLAEVPGAQSVDTVDTVADFDRLSSGEATAPSAAEARSTREKLKQTTSLRFKRDTLEAALEQLSKDVDVKIVIRGADLQADGITKNQSFGIDLENKPAEEILVEILRLANPDKTATAANDVKQKLVYVIAPLGEGGTEQVIVTTRTAATQRGDELPAAFQLAAP